jgi:orotidine-5'-phosphate decarboxylase
MTKKELFAQILKKGSFLCIGLDTDIEKIPKHLYEFEDPIFEFNKGIINTTQHLAVAYKLNLAFYESLGPDGMISFEETVNYIEETDSKLFIIADAKRGDIGNTSKMYAKTFFKYYNCDAVTVAPYMGSDSVEPFLLYRDKWTILLSLTSNKGANDFQWNKDSDYLFNDVIKRSQKWENSSAENLMYVVGATKAEYLKDIRFIAPNHFLLIPGVGAQGGSLQKVAENGMNDHCGILVNSSRGIIYAGDGKDFAKAAQAEAFKLQQQMSVLLQEAGLL